MGQRLADRPHLRVIPRVLENVARMRRHHRNRLRDIERSPSADTDDAVGVMRAIRPRTLHHLASHRVAPDAGKDGMLDACKLALESGENRQRGKAPIGHDQRTRTSRGEQVCRHFTACTGAEHDRRRKGEAMQAHECRALR